MTTVCRQGKVKQVHIKYKCRRNNVNGQNENYMFTIFTYTQMYLYVTENNINLTFYTPFSQKKMIL